MLCDWHVQVCMLDYDVDPEKGKKSSGAAL